MDLGAKSGKMELNMKENMYQAVKKDMAELFSQINAATKEI